MTENFWLAPQPLLLASTSATRRDMLMAAGLAIETTAPGVDERAVDREARERHASAAEIAGLLADAKALAVSGRSPERWVLGADQTLVCEGELFDKPADRAAAVRQLQALSGRTHRLISAATLAKDGAIVATICATAELTVRPLSDEFILSYIEAMGDKALGSVGGYQVEGLGVQLFNAIAGDHFTILGLPLLQVLAVLREHGALAG